MKFKIVSQTAKMSAIRHEGYILRQDKWNDYGFQTLYHLYRSDGSASPESIGEIKILKRGQTESDPIQIDSDFDELPEGYCSLGQSLDYYERLGEGGTDVRKDVLARLRDVIQDIDIRDSFKEEPGYSTALCRDHKEGSDFFLVARHILEVDITLPPPSEFKFSFQVAGWASAVNFDFSSTTPRSIFHSYGDGPTPPNRICVVIGRNGVGKSTFLSRLARVAYASPQQREKYYTEVGAIDPPHIGFSRIIAVNYNAFDGFVLPGLGLYERQRIAKEVSDGIGRFIYCGLRDIISEQGDSVESIDHRHSEEELLSYAQQDVSTSCRILSHEFASARFANNIIRIKQKARNLEFKEALRGLRSEPSITDVVESLINEDETIDALSRLYASLSSGHKIVLQIISSIAASALPRSLVILDEPENHLHPPLAAALVHSTNHLLEKFDSYAVIATHSPVVLQEALGKNVSVLRKNGDRTQASPLPLESFGESVGILTTEVFSLNFETADHQKALRSLVESGLDFDQVNALFRPHGLSSQAAALVRTLTRKQ